MAHTQAVYYRDADGEEPVDVFIEALIPKQAAKIDFYVEEYLNGQAATAPPVGYPITSQVRGGLRELRVRFAKTYFRLLFQRSENLHILLHIFEKDTKQLPEADIELAERRFIDFKARMNAYRRVAPRPAGQDAPTSRRQGT
ncbi:MAG: type II toxin-antitoxin system RelE/ParE family toxin [Thermoleophilaceae bacterium]